MRVENQAVHLGRHVGVSLEFVQASVFGPVVHENRVIVVHADARQELGLAAKPDGGDAPHRRESQPRALLARLRVPHAHHGLATNLTGGAQIARRVDAQTPHVVVVSPKKPLRVCGGVVHDPDRRGVVHHRVRARGVEEITREAVARVPVHVLELECRVGPRGGSRRGRARPPRGREYPLATRMVDDLSLERRRLARDERPPAHFRGHVRESRRGDEERLGERGVRESPVPGLAVFVKRGDGFDGGDAHAEGIPRGDERGGIYHAGAFAARVGRVERAEGVDEDVAFALVQGARGSERGAHVALHPREGGTRRDAGVRGVRGAGVVADVDEAVEIGARARGGEGGGRVEVADASARDGVAVQVQGGTAGGGLRHAHHRAGRGAAIEVAVRLAVHLALPEGRAIRFLLHRGDDGVLHAIADLRADGRDVRLGVEGWGVHSPRDGRRDRGGISAGDAPRRRQRSNARRPRRL